MAAVDYIVQAFDIILVIFLWTWWIFIIAGMWFMKKKYSQYPVDVVIIERRGENLIKTNERAGRKVNKETQISYYQLSKCKDTMPVYNFDWMLHNADKPMSIFEKIVGFLRPTIGTVFLFKYGSKQYKPININQKPGTENKLKLKEVKNEDGTSLFKYEYAQFDPRWPLSILDFEVVDWDNMNFMVQEQRASIMRRAGGLDWMKQLAVPAMLIAGTVIVALFILKFSAEAGATLKGGAGQPAAEKTGGIIGGAIDGVISPPAG
ncbi:hypothetical protein LCGC14_0708150 [marine sediment metagenome]|uniref:Uncharacterized protein n=1 Tax=marine sediment metagenome TaxID=412755 RepID=A0A0F9QFV6_9ZZZZ